MRLYLQNKENKGFEYDEDNQLYYTEISGWSFWKCHLYAILMTWAIFISFGVAFYILGGLMSLF